MTTTSGTATGFFGDKLYQQRARAVLPILIRQAKAKKPIYYETLAQEMGMPNPRNLNYPLGCIGDALNALAEEWGSEVPHIQSIVVNQATDLPGPGFDGFLTSQGFAWETKDERRAVIETYWAKVTSYPYWNDVLEALGLEPTKTDLADLIDRAGHGGGGGEGPEHLALKMFITRNPAVVGLKHDDADGEVEFCLPSGDSVDVVFNQKRRVRAVEVKPAGASVEDVTRGLFQCVKYRAVMEALAGYLHDERPISVCLVLGGALPTKLVELRNSLGIEVIDSISPAGN